jgi:hypothetical protein
LQHRRNENDVANRINVEDPAQVRDSVISLFSARYPGADLTPLQRGFNDFQALFTGCFPGYLACDTLYHDMRHSLDMTLALARLIDGHDRVVGESERLGARRAMLGVLIALLHDSGYLKRTSEATVDNGAVFTKVHVSRSADFIATYLPKVGFAEEAALAARLVHFTGYEMDIDVIRVDDVPDRTVGCMVGAADLIDMSDRMYLEGAQLYENSSGTRSRASRCPTAAGGALQLCRRPDDQDARFLRIRRPGAHRQEARRRGPLRRGALRRHQPVPVGNRPQHGLPAPDDRDRRPAAPAALLLLALELQEARRRVAARRRPG